MSPPTDRVAKARAVRSQRSAERAVDDPRQLARAARIVRAALARKALEPADLLDGPEAA
jgi:hypothetical protein